MTLVGRLPIGRNGYPGLHHVVHDDQIGCRDQRHEAGHQRAGALDPMSDGPRS